MDDTTDLDSSYADYPESGMAAVRKKEEEKQTLVRLLTKLRRALRRRGKEGA